MVKYNIVAATTENTVVTSYEPVKNRSDSYQSETALEQEFIQMLTQQGYEYLTIHQEADLIANLRRQLKALNGYQFIGSEWERFSPTPSSTPTSTLWRRPRRSKRTSCRCSGGMTAPQ